MGLNCLDVVFVSVCLVTFVRVLLLCYLRWVWFGLGDLAWWFYLIFRWWFVLIGLGVGIGGLVVCWLDVTLIWIEFGFGLLEFGLIVSIFV